MWNNLRKYVRTIGANYVPSKDVPGLRFVDPEIVGDEVKKFTLNEADPRIIAEGQGEKIAAQTGKLFADHPGKLLVGGVAGIAGNALLGNPVGGTIDAVTGGYTNFKADATPSVAVMPKTAGLPPAYREVNDQAINAGVPALSADDLRRQVDYYQRRIRTDLETLKVLEQQHYKANALGLE